MYLPSTVSDVPLEADDPNTESLNPGECFSAGEHLNEEDPQSSTTVISPFPQGNARKSRRKAKESYQDVLTTSPYL
ncbi:unnamed protein product [Acanthoscelides obtectus]|uniref:Uncharacterized protein n=1 Tax=Acanthoscelides obtectus TaxID=200917 RepID=A0A9P0KV86_ACAOB|nr:unnamed protein product [Acanthoscelides obtectus]CAK1634330.1 hypothetical protein AOBTE_LOCUS8719 [Acanthoscelides obtectus]